MAEECLEYNEIGDCVKYRFTDETGSIVDLSACPLETREKIKKDLINKGVIIKEKW